MLKEENMSCSQHGDFSSGKILPNAHSSEFILLVKPVKLCMSNFKIIQPWAQTSHSAVFPVFCRIEDLPPPKKLTPELTSMVLFTGFEPMQVQQYIKVTFRLISCELH